MSHGIYTTQLRVNISPLDLYWFLRYGPPIMMATLINVFKAPVNLFINSIISTIIKKRLILKQKLHRGLLRMLTPTPFSMEGIFPYLISFMMTCLTLLPGMPLMMPCLFFLVLLQFVIRRYLFIKQTSIPKTSYQKTLKILIKGVPLALMVPLAPSLMIYTNFYNSSLEDFQKCGDDGFCSQINFLVSL